MARTLAHSQAVTTRAKQVQHSAWLLLLLLCSAGICWLCKGTRIQSAQEATGQADRLAKGAVQQAKKEVKNEKKPLAIAQRKGGF